jgi:hypothetical protein
MTDTSAVASWYDQNADGEHKRLQNLHLEFAISLHVILQCVQTLQDQRPQTKLQVLELGGGTGRYGEGFYYDAP